MDVFGLTLPITAIDGVRMVPWAMYANIGADSGFWNYLGRSPGQFTGYNAAGAAQYDKGGWASTDTHAWYAGLALNVDIFDPLTFAFDAMYGNLQGGNDSLRDSTPGTKGWFVDAALRYKLDWGTAGLFGWYASGDDDDAIKNNEYGRLPSLGYDWGPGFTSFGFDGSTADLYSDWHVSISAVGTWGLGLEIVNMSFFEDLSHTIRVTYYAGTNDADLVKNNPGSFGRRQNNNMFIGEFQYMTDEDYAVEVNFDHIYTIYEGFTAHLDLGYINMNLDEGTWKHTSLGHETDDAWKATLTFQFRF
jgi:hypothetical protein